MLAISFLIGCLAYAHPVDYYPQTHTQYVVHSAPASRWVPGHYDHAGYWVPGYWVPMQPRYVTYPTYGSSCHHHRVGRVHCNRR